MDTPLDIRIQKSEYGVERTEQISAEKSKSCGVIWNGHGNNMEGLGITRVSCKYTTCPRGTTITATSYC